MTTSPWPAGLAAITLFTEDLNASKTFYGQAFGLSPVFADESSAVFKFGNTMINLLHIAQADELVNPAPVAETGSGSRSVYTLLVDDVDPGAPNFRGAASNS